MTRDRHPSLRRQADEERLRLYWVAPRLGRWTAVFEHRFYGNESRRRWGVTDDELASALSADLGVAVWRIEVVDQARFWLYSRVECGREVEGRAYQDEPGAATVDRSHPRYELNRICEREGFPYLGLSYEEIPGPMVAPVERIPQGGEGIEGLARFAHRAFAKPP